MEIGRNGQNLKINKIGTTELFSMSGSQQMALSPKSSQILSFRTFGKNAEAQPAFRINTERGIPDGQTVRSNADSKAALENLILLPAHKQGTVKFDASKMQRSLSPLTFEDTDQFHNLGLIATLRNSAVKAQQQHLKAEGQVDQTGEEASQADNNLMTTIPMPPSFYEDDIAKKYKKYEMAIKDRQVFKQKFLRSQNLNISAI